LSVVIFRAHDAQHFLIRNPYRFTTYSYAPAPPLFRARDPFSTPSGDILRSVLRISLRRPEIFPAWLFIVFFFFIFAFDILKLMYSVRMIFRVSKGKVRHKKSPADENIRRAGVWESFGGSFALFSLFSCFSGRVFAWFSPFWESLGKVFTLLLFCPFTFS
jgi:hypothetical protein